MKKCILFIGIQCLIQYSFAQKKITNQSLIWYTYAQDLKINNRFSVYTDIQERHFIAPLKQSQLVMRSTLKTAIKHNFDFGVGFCFFLSNTDPTVDFDLQTPEVRPYIEFNNKQAFKRVTVSHRARMEARFFHNVNGNELAKGFSFGNMRFRYQFGLDILLNKPKEEKHAVKLKIMEEVMINFGKKIKYNSLDQNRISVLLVYAPIKAVAFELGYVNWFQQRPSGDKYFNRNILRVGVVHHIHLKKKEN
ncbi:MAG: DUF2490 domain-containing protein [Chitinophagales bacterium]|nr:DUF2490 domain-containing protein [Chitinophagales bacterium]